MKHSKKYNINLEEIYEKHLEGYSLPELSEEYEIPRTTLNRYLREAGYVIYVNRYRSRMIGGKKRGNMVEFVCPNAWRQAIIDERGFKCQVCGYSKILECHHIIPTSKSGKSTRENGILLCPNHHAEAHAGLLLEEDLLKYNEQTEVVRKPVLFERRCDFEIRRK